MDINHIHLAVDDLEASKDFYRNYFGFKDAVVHGKIQFMANDAGFQLALDPRYKSDALPEWFHIGTRLQSAEEVEALHSKMSNAKHFILRSIERYPGHVFFHCVDPDGYKIEVYWEE